MVISEADKNGIKESFERAKANLSRTQVEVNFLKKLLNDKQEKLELHKIECELFGSMEENYAT